VNPIRRPERRNHRPEDSPGPSRTQGRVRDSESAAARDTTEQSAAAAPAWTLSRGPRRGEPDGGLGGPPRAAGRSVVAPPGRARRRADPERARCWMLSRGPAGTSPTEARSRARSVLDAQSWLRRGRPDGGPIPKALGAGCSVVAPPGQARRRPSARAARFWTLSRGPAGAGPTEAFCAAGAVLDAQSWPRRGGPDGGLLRGRRGSGRSVVAPPGRARRRPDPERARCWMLSRGSAGAGPTEPFCAAGAVLDAQSWPRRDKPDGGLLRGRRGSGRSVVAPPGQA